MLIDKAIFKNNKIALFLTDNNYIVIYIIDMAVKRHQVLYAAQ